MKALIQRVSRAKVMIDGSEVSSIGRGLLILLGIRQGDTDDDAQYLAAKCSTLRIFDDEKGKMNLSVRDISGAALAVSQFTLYGDTRHGNRPSFIEAARPEEAELLYQKFVAYLCQQLGEKNVGTGIFRAMMEVELVNDGPVTVMIESKE